MEVEKNFTCPITGEVFQDPVAIEDGNVYEREAIEKWFKRKQTSPLTGLPVRSITVIPIHCLRNFLQNRTSAGPVVKNRGPAVKKYKSMADAWNQIAKGTLSNSKYKDVKNNTDDPILEHVKQLYNAARIPRKKKTHVPSAT